MKNTVLALFLATFLPHFVLASDHIDGPITSKHRVGDLTDLYSFPTPNRPGFMTIVLNAYPLVPSNGHFSDRVNYTLIIRKTQIPTADQLPFFVTEDEVSINCVFKTPHDTVNHSVACKSSNGLIAEKKYGQVSAIGNDGFLVYSGMRSDPFFFNKDWLLSAMNKSKLLPAKNSDAMSRLNVLTIVLELEMKKFFGDMPHSLFAVAAETTTQDSPTARLRRLDRVGRPEITNVSLVAHNEPDLRDSYNTDRPFQEDPARREIYRQRLEKNISYYDDIDGKKDWRPIMGAMVSGILSLDFLVVDIAKPCSADSFLEIEKSLLNLKPHQSCGGRKLTDDVVDDLVTFYVAGPNGARIKDGVDSPSRPLSGQFPYLAAPDLSALAKAKASLGRKALGLK